jgi:hypothetical protein
MLLTRNSSRRSTAGSQQPPPLRPQQQQGSEPQGSAVVGIHHYSGSWMDWDASSSQTEEQQLNREVRCSRSGVDVLLSHAASQVCLLDE